MSYTNSYGFRESESYKKRKLLNDLKNFTISTPEFRRTDGDSEFYNSSIFNELISPIPEISNYRTREWRDEVAEKYDAFIERDEERYGPLTAGLEDIRKNQEKNIIENQESQVQSPDQNEGSNKMASNFNPYAFGTSLILGGADAYGSYKQAEADKTMYENLADSYKQEAGKYTDFITNLREQQTDFFSKADEYEVGGDIWKSMWGQTLSDAYKTTDKQREHDISGGNYSEAIGSHKFQLTMDEAAGKKATITKDLSTIGLSYDNLGKSLNTEIADLRKFKSNLMTQSYQASATGDNIDPWADAMYGFTSSVVPFSSYIFPSTQK